MAASSGSSLLRNVLGMVLGGVAMAALLGIVGTWAGANLHPGPENPNGPVLIHLACDFAAALGGGYICALVARNPKASLWMAGLILVCALLYQTRPAEPGEPSWYRLALLLVGPVGVYAGGWLRGG